VALIRRSPADVLDLDLLSLTLHPQPFKNPRACRTNCFLLPPLTFPTSRRLTSSAMASSSNLVSSRQPPFIYGTAWKKDQTAVLVKEAVRAGFRAVDTAAQPRHYQEDLVGKGLREAYSQGLVRRDGIYVSSARRSHFGAVS